MTISLTENAAKHVQNFLAKRGKGVGSAPWCAYQRLLRYGV